MLFHCHIPYIRALHDIVLSYIIYNMLLVSVYIIQAYTTTHYSGSRTYTRNMALLCFYIKHTYTV